MTTSDPNPALAPCGSCATTMLDCLNAWIAGRGVCCPDCDKHGYTLTDRGEAAVDAMRDGLTYEDAELLHGKAPE